MNTAERWSERQLDSDIKRHTDQYELTHCQVCRRDNMPCNDPSLEICTGCEPTGTWGEGKNNSDIWTDADGNSYRVGE
jgi:hypothetical protein